MNREILKDPKTILGFVLSFLFELIGIALAAADNDFWVAFVVLGIILTFYSAGRANRIYTGAE